MHAAILFLWSVIATQDTARPESYALSQCALVQLADAPRLFLALPSNELTGIDLRTGRILWRTESAAFPLLARGNRLLALLPPVSGRPGWLLGVIDASSGVILSRLPPWGEGAGTVGDGMGTSMRLEVVTEGGRDYLVWRSRVQRISGVPGNYPIHLDSGAAEVTLVPGSLTPLPQGLPSRSLALHVEQPAGYHTDTFAVDDLRAVAAREYVNPGFRLVLHRWRGRESLPDLVVGKPGQGSDAISVSQDRRHVLGVVQDPSASPRYHYSVVVFSTITGQSIGRLVSEWYPATFVVWDHRLISFLPDRVSVGDLATGRSLYEWPTRDLRYHGSYPPAAVRR